MLSADPLPQITLARFAAQTTPRASGSIRFPAHHLLVTLDSCAALALGEPRPRTQPALVTTEFSDRPSCRAGSRRRCAPSCWQAPRRQAEGLLLDQLLGPHPQRVGVWLAVKQHRMR